VCVEEEAEVEEAAMSEVEMEAVMSVCLIPKGCTPGLKAANDADVC
jgi:hypothetical protein